MPAPARQRRGGAPIRRYDVPDLMQVMADRPPLRLHPMRNAEAPAALRRSVLEKAMTPYTAERHGWILLVLLLAALYPLSSATGADPTNSTTEVTDMGPVLPPMDSRRGRELFLSKGCVVCHSVNGVGGRLGPSLDAAAMPRPMDPLGFAARMWRGAPDMVETQRDLLGGAIDLSAQDLADLIAFAYDEAEQRMLKAEDIPAQFRDRIMK
jgi:mono/diheme cytochrome c family protein